MSFSNLNFNQVKNAFIVPLLVVAIIGGGYFVILPKYRAWSADKARLLEKQNQLAQRQTDLSRVQNLISQLKDKREDLKPLDEAIPNAPRLPELLANLDYLTQQSGLVIKNLDISLPSAEELVARGQRESASRLEEILGRTKGLQVMRIDMVMAGEYGNLQTFLANLEQNLRLMDVQKLGLESNDDESESSEQEYSLQIVTYYQKGLTGKAEAPASP